MNTEENTATLASIELVNDERALAASPKVAVRVGFGACYKDESEQEIDPLQAKLPINP